RYIRVDLKLLRPIPKLQKKLKCNILVSFDSITVIDLGKKEFAAGLSFVAIFRVRSLDDILFKHFSL
ncbi:hypothetical protein GLOIN_2v1602684, partial [Rhizophagus irregularis DAOM 181602=DAOM 197198]